GFGQLATALYRSGYASARQLVLIAVVAVLSIFCYAIVVGVAPSLRSSDAALHLTVLAFIAGVPAYGAMTILPVAAHHDRFVRVLADRWHLAVIGYAQAVTVLIGFLLLAIFELA